MGDDGDVTMPGVRCVVDEKGNRTAVQIDLREHGRLWEGFHDVWLAQQRESEPRESLEAVRETLDRVSVSIA